MRTSRISAARSISKGSGDRTPTLMIPSLFQDQGAPMFRKAVGYLLVLLVVSGCGGHSPTAPSLSVAGSWQGNFSSDGDEPGTFTLQLSQSGTNVSGMASMAQNEFTNIPGTWQGTLAAGATSMPFTLNYAFGPQPCQGV